MQLHYGAFNACYDPILLKQEAQLPKKKRASNIALSYGAESISICWTV